MNTLCVWCFADPEAAERVLPRLSDARVVIDDAALVTWPPGRRTPASRELGSSDGPGHLWGGFWGMLLGLIFVTPVAGPTFGAAAGALAGRLADFGVADDFVKRVRETVTPGRSAIFALCDRPSAEWVGDRLAGLDLARLRSELSLEQAQHLRDTLGDR
ncbi:MAG TPA: DUF1269 domain-containing protein [Solirubrobacter sp.]|nr:DUF1269 domain-containing protein [Solirubrobacter sp.]